MGIALPCKGHDKPSGGGPMDPKDLSSMAKILLQLSDQPKAFGDSNPVVTQLTTMANLSHMTDAQGDDADHQSTALTLRPLLSGLSQEEREKLIELLTLLELDFIQFKEALLARGISVKGFMAMFNQNGLLIPLSSPQYQDAFIQKLANLYLLPKDYKCAPTKSAERQQESTLSSLSLFAMKPSLSKNHGSERAKLNEATHSQHPRSHPSPFSMVLKPRSGITFH